MKCVGCDQVLSDYEATRKYEINYFVDLCNDCMSNVDEDLVTLTRVDLLTVGDE